MYEHTALTDTNIINLYITILASRLASICLHFNVIDSQAIEKQRHANHL